MNEQELQEYLKKNLNIKWAYDDSSEKLYIALCLKDEVISKIQFEQY